MATSSIIYTGELRTVATHLQSGVEIITDAPTDNQGKGEAFSPTDLLATSLGCCMLTIMGINARTNSMNIDGTKVEITKIMAANPRRVSEIGVIITLPNNSYSEKERKMLEIAALNCPVAKSLHPDIKQDVKFIWA
jgi:putative redox protein